MNQTYRSKVIPSSSEMKDQPKTPRFSSKAMGKKDDKKEVHNDKWNYKSKGVDWPDMCKLEGGQSPANLAGF